MIDAQECLLRLLAANRVVVAELSVRAVLRRIVESARDLGRAGYAALGLLSGDGLLEQSIHVGMDDATVNKIGELPNGRGVLSALIEDPRRSGSTRIAGRPKIIRIPGQPSAHGNLLGVPIRSRKEIFGDLHLGDHVDGAFSRR